MKRLILFSLIAFGTITSAHGDESAASITDYTTVATSINEKMRKYHYNPAELESEEYKRIEAATVELGAIATADDQFIEGFREIWHEGPFSHVEFRKAQQSADQIAAYLDNLSVGGGGAVLSWKGDVAVLTVNTMMGLDTIEEIDAAYAAIAERQTEGLIIDLRENGGGAFAVRPLVAHLLDEPFDAGSFVSRHWNASHDGAPTREEMDSVEAWEGWSIRVFVLTSSKTASAAELATDALKASGRAVIIGENTAGEMLSQKIFDIPGGFHLSLPVADYYSIENGRIEGAGIKPDISVEAAKAMDVALEQIISASFSPPRR